MTDEEYWLHTEHVEVMLRVLHGKGSDRKLRLFTCACCRDVKKVMTEREIQAVSLAELFADGQVDDIERVEFLCSFVNALEGSTVEYSRHGIPSGYSVVYHPRELFPVLSLMADDEYLVDTNNCRPIVGMKVPQHYGYERARLVARWTATMLAYECQENSRGFLGRVHEVMFRYVNRLIDGYWPCGITIDGGYYTEPVRVQCTRLWDIFGNPFRPVALDSAWLTSDVLTLARGIYEERAFDRMPILADALQDAGCDNDDVLVHCRDTALAHVRGCWVLGRGFGVGEGVIRDRVDF